MQDLAVANFRERTFWALGWIRARERAGSASLGGGDNLVEARSRVPCVRALGSCRRGDLYPLWSVLYGKRRAPRITQITYLFETSFGRLRRISLLGRS